VVSNIDSVRPFYLRSVPFILFSDPVILDLNLTLFTEWHIQQRHPTRIVDSWFNLGRARYQASFTTEDGDLKVQFTPHTAGTFPLPEGTLRSGIGRPDNQAIMQFNQGVGATNGGAYQAALDHYHTALRLWPTYGEAQNNIGVILVGGGKIEEGLSCFELAIRNKPDYFDPYVNAAAVLLDLGRVAEATPYIERALQLDPNSVKAKNLRSRLKAMK
jgi:tetratricopeptide (TPR) repeat protein